MAGGDSSVILPKLYDERAKYPLYPFNFDIRRLPPKRMFLSALTISMQSGYSKTPRVENVICLQATIIARNQSRFSACTAKPWQRETSERLWMLQAITVHALS
ncbi:unnamed protein product [Dracunculus medinensis]|uniref:Uncharacterized protein n=1 Tax=Dracunculus medinensis TaxID=318479 RepID=A0A0N4UMT0_DRAME|nr:unnamed protein product [Dracunculus medinensis]